MAFHNTIGAKGEELRRREAITTTQEERVLAFFVQNPGLKATPFEVHERVIPEAPVTSIRRAITNLTRQGKLIKLKARREERLGAPNALWMLSLDALQQTELF